MLLLEKPFLKPHKMQNVINTVKGTALGVAEFLTPVLKVNLLSHTS